MCNCKFGVVTEEKELGVGIKPGFKIIIPAGMK